jgi:Zn-dependent protease
MSYRYESAPYSFGEAKPNRRPSWIFLGIVAIFITGAWLLWAGVGNEHLAAFLYVAAGWVVSLCLHEFGHALLAYRGGDRGVADRGYLTLDPRKYTNPVLSIALPLLFIILGGIGLPGGAVWVNHHAIRGSRLRHAMISLIGPLTNFAFAIALSIPFLLGLPSAQHVNFWVATGFLAVLQFTAGVLNILPIPGLDGGNAIEPYLNDDWKRGFAHVRPWGFLIVVLLLWNTRANYYFFTLVFKLSGLFGVGIAEYVFGRALFWPFRPLY